jgi:hypothetical protein
MVVLVESVCGHFSSGFQILMESQQGDGNSKILQTELLYLTFITATCQS